MTTLLLEIKKILDRHNRAFVIVSLIVFAVCNSLYLLQSRSGREQDHGPVESYFLIAAMAAFVFTVYGMYTKLAQLEFRINPSGMQFFPGSLEMYGHLCTQIDGSRITGTTKAILLQYSGHYAYTLVERLVKKGIDVDLWVQYPATACSTNHGGNIRNECLRLERDANMWKSDKPKSARYGTLAIRRFTVPATIRAVNIDNNLLAVGMYDYYPHVDEESEIRGHDNPGVIFELHSAHFAAVLQHFNRVVKSYEESQCRIPDEGMRNTVIAFV